MGTIRQGLRRLAAGGILLREIRGLRKEVQGLAAAATRIAEILEADYSRRYGPLHPTETQTPAGMEITYITDEGAQQWMEKELDLTRAMGRPPTEEEILAAFEREAQTPQTPESRNG